MLAVDADPNTCLDAVLGVKAENTIGRVREESKQAAREGIPVGIPKQDLLNLKIAESLVEAEDFDLIAMGRPEGPGCYCYANNVLKDALQRLSAQYPYVVLDNEAGLENLSRRIVQKVDLLVMVADPSARGLETVRRLYSLALEMEIRFDTLAIVVNRLRKDSLPDQAEELRTETGADFMIGLPDDEELASIAESGKSLESVSSANRVASAIDGFLSELGLFKSKSR